MLSLGGLLLFVWSMAGDRGAPVCTLAPRGENAVMLCCEVEGKGTFGTATAIERAERHHNRRLTLSGEMLTRDVTGGASFWLRLDSGETMLLLDNGASDALKGTNGWTKKSVTLPVPPSATTIVFGVLLRGGGTVEARNIKLESVPIGNAPMANEAREELDAALNIIRKNALNRDKVDWPAVEPTARMMAAGAQKASDTYPAIRYLLGALRDRHSFLMPPREEQRIAATNNPLVAVRALGGGVASIALQGYSGGVPEKMKAFVRDAHEKLARTDAPCGWIVDLRGNTGGNMWPMLAALRPFLGDASLGTFMSGNSKWFANRAVDIPTPANLRPLQKARVAVLTGPRTASSGEAVVVAFRGRPGTRFFGQPTAGLSTANAPFPLPDGASILLTTSIFADRTGKKYGEKIEPDEVITGDDATIAAATKWLACK